MRQVGGDHYESSYQHWDWAIDCGLGPLEYGATRYVVRHRKKNGKQDIDKAIHFVEKILSLNTSLREKYWVCRCNDRDIGSITDRFESANKIHGKELEICEILATWKDKHALKYALVLLNELKAAYTDVPSTQSGQGVAGVAARAGWPISDAPVVAGTSPNYTEHPAPFGYNAEDEQ